jgi:hypothetical protein
MFIVASKRLAEKRRSTFDNARKVVNLYSIEFLLSCSTISSAIALLGYCLWAFNQIHNPFWFQLSVIPLVMGFYRYSWMGNTSVVEVPEDALFGDRPLLILGASLMILLSFAIYL